MAAPRARIVFAPPSPASRLALAAALREASDAGADAAEAAIAAYAGLAPQIARLNAALLALRAAWRSRNEEPTQ